MESDEKQVISVVKKFEYKRARLRYDMAKCRNQLCRRSKLLLVLLNLWMFLMLLFSCCCSPRTRRIDLFGLRADVEANMRTCEYHPEQSYLAINKNLTNETGLTRERLYMELNQF